MSTIFRLDRASGALIDVLGRRFDPVERRWDAGNARVAGDSLESVDLLDAVAWLQRDSGHPLRVPVAVIGPREATDGQLAAALQVGELLARCGLVVICGGRHGVMQAVCEGVARNGGVSIGLLGDSDPALANPYARVIVATGIGEARNALIARSAFCLIALGDSLGTLSEVALGLHFGKAVFGLEGAAQVAGVRQVASATEAAQSVARLVLRLD